MPTVVATNRHLVSTCDSTGNPHGHCHCFPASSSIANHLSPRMNLQKSFCQPHFIIIGQGRHGTQLNSTQHSFVHIRISVSKQAGEHRVGSHVEKAVSTLINDLTTCCLGVVGRPVVGCHQLRFFAEQLSTARNHGFCQFILLKIARTFIRSA